MVSDSTPSTEMLILSKDENVLRLVCVLNLETSGYSSPKLMDRQPRNK